MTQNDKDLLLQDICSRLPYGVKFVCNKNIYTVKGIDLIVTDKGDWKHAVTAKGITPIEIDFIKPYLFPLVSMTEEQNIEYLSTCKGGNAYYPTSKSFDWFDKNHFDYRGLIPMGLAEDATGLNIY